MFNLLVRSSILCLLSYHSFGQRIANNADFIKALLADTGYVSNITFPRHLPQPIDGLNIPFAKDSTGILQRFILNKHGLFALVDGTGHVYKIENIDDELRVTRIDSTLFFGYNFGAFNFSYQDTIFSYGGYGYWRYNGDLRYYLPSVHEWELRALLKEIPIQVSNPWRIQGWHDQKAGTLYVNGMPSEPLARDTIYALDLKTSSWKTLGISLLPGEDFGWLMQTPWGIMSRAWGSEKDNFYLLDLVNNDIKLLDAGKMHLLKSLRLPEIPSYFSDSTLVLQGKDLVRVTFTSANFISTGRPIYESLQDPPLMSTLTNHVLRHVDVMIGTMVGFIIAMLLSSRWKRSRQKATPVPVMETEPSLFDAKEKNLIQFIHSNSQLKQVTSIEDINRILGLSDKSVDLQKKHRSDTISSINKKFRYTTRTEGTLLKKSRSDLDKRSFEYYIDTEDYKKVSHLF